jgi:hypothetical protein
MKSSVLYWTPRALGIALALFFGVFALDVFGESRGFWNTVVALAMHLVPAALIVATLTVAWRRPIVGGVLFGGLGVCYLVWSWGRFPPSVPLTIGGAPLLIGALFMLERRPVR